MQRSGRSVDMTQGSTFHHVITFTIPLLVGNLFQQFYNLVDSLVVGNFVGANALAAVGTCGSLNYLIFSLSSGLSVGLGVMAAQAFGAKRDGEIRKIIASGIYILAGAGILVSILFYALAPSLLRLLRAPETILPDAVTYLRLICLGTVAVALYNGIAAILRAMGDSKTSLYFLIAASVVNVVLDLAFVLGLGMGVFGVGLATLISQLLSFVISLGYALMKVPCFRLTGQELKPEGKTILRALNLGIPVAAQSSIISVSTMALQGVVNGFGETVMAAYTVVDRVEQIVQQPYTSLGTALTSFAGQNVGAQKLDRVKQGFRVATWMTLVFSLILLPIAYLFGPQIIGIFVKDPQVIAIGARGLQINCLFYFALGMIYVPRSILNGAGDSSFAMINGLTEVACRVVYSNVFTRIPAIGYWGIWITTGFTWGTTALVCLHRYFKGKWRKMFDK
mgnify:FL=1